MPPRNTNSWMRPCSASPAQHPSVNSCVRPWHEQFRARMRLRARTEHFPSGPLLPALFTRRSNKTSGSAGQALHSLGRTDGCSVTVQQSFRQRPP